MGRAKRDGRWKELFWGGGREEVSDAELYTYSSCAIISLSRLNSGSRDSIDIYFKGEFPPHIITRKSVMKPRGERGRVGGEGLGLDKRAALLRTIPTIMV